MNRLIALSLIPVIGLTSVPPVRSNPAAIAIPAVCASGVGCVLVGTAIVGSSVVWIVQNLRTGEQYRSAPAPMPSRAFHIEGNIPGQVEIHYASTENGCYAMQKRFRQEGRRLRMRRPQNVGGSLPWKCTFDGPDATDDYYGENRYGRDR